MGTSKSIVKDYAKVCKENTKLIEQVEARDEKIAEVKKELKEEKKKCEKQDKIIESQKAEIKEDKEKIRQLERDKKILEEKLAKVQAQLNRNSDNSSESTGTNPNTPRSEKQPKSANAYNGRQTGERKKGGQPGHKGASLGKKELADLLKQDNVIHEIIDEGDPTLPYVSEFTVEIITTLKVTETRLHQDSGKSLRAHPGSIFYGDSFKALSVLLNTELNVSYHKIAAFIKDLTGGALHPSKATVYDFCMKFSEKSKEKNKELALKLLSAPILYTDSTVMVVNGERKNIRIYTTPDAALYQALESKSGDELEEKSLLAFYDGILVHDHETVMYHFGKEHSECVVHELRYCRKIQDETGNAWSYEMEKFFQRLLDERKKALERQESRFSDEEIAQYKEQYHKIIEEGYRQNQTTQFDFARKNEKAFLNRLVKYEDNVLLFLTDFEIRPDNNLSESRLRGAKTKQKVTGGFKTFEGLERYADSLSVIKTIKDSDENVLESLKAVFKD